MKIRYFILTIILFMFTVSLSSEERTATLKVSDMDTQTMLAIRQRAWAVMKPDQEATTAEQERQSQAYLYFIYTDDWNDEKFLKLWKKYTTMEKQDLKTIDIDSLKINTSLTDWYSMMIEYTL